VVEAFLWSLLGASSLVIGVVLISFWTPAARTLGLVMAFGAGVLLSAVSFELVEEAVETSGGAGGAALGFFAGVAVFTLGDLGIARMGYRDRKDIDAAPHDAAGPAIVLGTLLDGIPESAVLGLTLLESGTVGTSMLVAVFISNLPESVAASASLRANGWSMRRILLLWTAIALLSALAAAAGYALLDGASPQVLAFIFAFAGGAILTMLSTSMIPEAYEHTGRLVGVATTLGYFLAFAIHLAE
jgi:ZIP family zinc transporter